MTRLHHPSNRADRLRIKAKKDKFDYSIDRASHVSKRLAEEALEQKEALDALRKEVLEEEIQRLHRDDHRTEPHRRSSSDAPPSDVSNT